MLHYYVKSFFAPVAVSGYVMNDMLFVYYVRDHPRVAMDLLLIVESYSWESFEILWSKTVNVGKSEESSVRLSFLNDHIDKHE